MPTPTSLVLPGHFFQQWCVTTLQGTNNTFYTISGHFVLLRDRSGGSAKSLRFILCGAGKSTANLNLSSIEILHGPKCLMDQNYHFSDCASGGGKNQHRIMSVGVFYTQWVIISNSKAEILWAAVKAVFFFPCCCENVVIVCVQSWWITAGTEWALSVCSVWMSMYSSGPRRAGRGKAVHA